MTLASHARGRGFDPLFPYAFYFLPLPALCAQVSPSPLAQLSMTKSGQMLQGCLLSIEPLLNPKTLLEVWRLVLVLMSLSKESFVDARHFDTVGFGRNVLSFMRVGDWIRVDYSDQV